MTVFVECTDDSGFESDITKGKTYRVWSFKGGSILINNDNGVSRWFGESKFSPPTDY